MKFKKATPEYIYHCQVLVHIFSQLQNMMADMISGQEDVHFDYLISPMFCGCLVASVQTSATKLQKKEQIMLHLPLTSFHTLNGNPTAPAFSSFLPYNESPFVTE